MANAPIVQERLEHEERFPKGDLRFDQRGTKRLDHKDRLVQIDQKMATRADMQRLLTAIDRQTVIP